MTAEEMLRKAAKAWYARGENELDPIWSQDVGDGQTLGILVGSVLEQMADNVLEAEKPRRHSIWDHSSLIASIIWALAAIFQIGYFVGRLGIK